MPTKRKRLRKSKKNAVSEKQDLGTKVVCSPKGNHILDDVKCCECGKWGHYVTQCPEKGRSSPMQNCEEGNHILHNKKCYKCGKCGHYVEQCPENRISSPGQGCEVLTTVATTNLEGNHVHVKCYECGNFGHYKKRCPEKGRSSPVQGREEGNHILHEKRCYRCGKCGHYVKQCPENRISSPVEGCEVLTTVATTNLEGGNMPEHVLPAALPASPVTLGEDNLDNLKCSECGMYGHFRNQCRNNDLCSPMQAYAVVLPTVATTWLEGGNTTQNGAPVTLPALPTPLSKRKRDSVKCFGCGKVGHYQNHCYSAKCFGCGKRGHHQDQCDSVKCFACGKRGHYQNQCQKKRRSSPMQAYGDLLTATATNSEGGHMSKHGALATLPTSPKTLENHNLDHSMCCECGKGEHFQNQCLDDKVSDHTQADAVPLIAATTDLEGFEFMQPSVGTFGSPSDHSSPSASSTAFGMTSSKSQLFGSASTSSACDVQNSSLCGSSNTLVLGSGYYTSAFKNSTQLAPAFGATGTSASERQSTTTAVGLNSNQLSPLVSNAIASNTLFGVPSQYAFGIPSTSVFGQSNATMMGIAGSMPALFGSTATTMSTSMSDFGFKSSLSYLFRTSSNSFGGLSNAPTSTFGSQATTPGNQTTTPGNPATMPGSKKTISESQATTPGNQVTAPGNQTSTLENQTTPECQTTTPECQTTTSEWKKGISDQQKSIETPYSSTQNIFGKSVLSLDKSSLKDKHYEDLSREDYHRIKGHDQKRVQARGQAQSSPIGAKNVASSFDQSPKSSIPKPPVVVTSEDSKGSGDTPYEATKTSVWWDIENCQVPRGSDTYYIAKNISSALADAGYKGAVTISAYGDTHKIPNAVQQALSSTGIALNHVPAGIKDASDKKILVDMLFWAVDNPPPANYLLISGDRDFSNALHQLRLRRYNILLAHAPYVSQPLVAAAKKVWQWSSLLSGGPPLQDLEPGAKTSGANRSSLNGIEGQIAKRLKQKDQYARGRQKTFSVPLSEEGCAIHSEELASFPRVSMLKPNEITELKHAPMSSLSREIVCAKRPRVSLNSSEQIPLESMFHSGNDKNPFNGQPFKVSQLLAPSNGAPSQNTSDNSLTTQAHHQHIMFGPPQLQSMHNKSTTNHHKDIKPPQLCDGYQMHYNEVHRHIGHIVSALTELKANKIVPTEKKISNCIRYGMGKQSIDVKMGLNYACKNNMLARYNLENCSPFYIEKNEEFWECINVLYINDKHSEETWNAVRNYLSSASGQLSISSTECRYHAATVLKKSRLQHLPLGEVLQVVNKVIEFKKWIIPSPSGWQPLTFTIKVLTSGNAKD